LQLFAAINRGEALVQPKRRLRFAKERAVQDLTVTVPYRLTRAEAKRRIQEQVAVVRHQHGDLLTNLQESWTDDNMTFSLIAMGHSISGRILVDDAAVHLIVTLPWLLHMLAETLKPRIKQQARLFLGSQKQEPAS
jgi:Putative polyhydroxyalkanoic acid system protein (PHA_gran_rgn)